MIPNLKMIVAVGLMGLLGACSSSQDLRGRMIQPEHSKLVVQVVQR